MAHSTVSNTIVCMYRTAGTAFIDCDYNKQQHYSVLLVLTECWQKYMQQYILLHSAISKQQTYPTLNSTYCYTQYNIKTTNLSYTQQYILLHSTISKQQTNSTLNTLYHNQQ